MKIPKINQFEIQNAIQSGTKFQQKVWKELLNIPYGQTKSYKHILRCCNFLHKVCSCARYSLGKIGCTFRWKTTPTRQRRFWEKDDICTLLGCT